MGGNSTKSLLLIIDVQNGFINANTVGVLDRIEEARNSLEYDSCAFTRFINHPDSNYTRFIGWSNMMSFEDQSLVLPLTDKDLVFDKTSYSPLTLDFQAFLSKERFDVAYICGIETDSCVLATAFSLFDLGIKPVIIIDCCATCAGEELQSAATMIMSRAFGKENIKALNDLCDGGSDL